MLNFDNLNEMFEEAQLDGSLPDGSYEVRVENIATNKTPKGYANFSWWLRITEGPYAEKMLFKNSILVSPRSISYYKRDLYFCKFYPENLSEAFTNYEPLIDVVLRVEKVTRDGFVTVYLKEYLGKSGGEEDVATATPF